MKSWPTYLISILITKCITCLCFRFITYFIKAFLSCQCPQLLRNLMGNYKLDETSKLPVLSYN
jgi:hypothetical protein